MLFIDSTRPVTPPPMPAPVPVPDHPVPPWRIELVEYVGRISMPGETRPTKVYPDGRRGALLVAGTEEEAWWQYATWLEGEVTRLQGALEAVPTGSKSIQITPDSTPTTEEVLEEVAPSRAVPGDEVVVQVASNISTTLTKREQAERALLESPTLNNCMIAERIAVSDEYVRRVRKELEAAGRLQPVAVLTKRDGTSYALADAAVGDDPATG